MVQKPFIFILLKYKMNAYNTTVYVHNIQYYNYFIYSMLLSFCEKVCQKVPFQGFSIQKWHLIHYKIQISHKENINKKNHLCSRYLPKFTVWFNCICELQLKIYDHPGTMPLVYPWSLVSAILPLIPHAQPHQGGIGLHIDICTMKCNLHHQHQLAKVIPIWESQQNVLRMLQEELQEMQTSRALWNFALAQYSMIFLGVIIQSDLS